MVVADVILDESCNSCGVHHNLSRVSTILPVVSVDDALEFLVQLCSELTDQEKHNVCKLWSFIQYLTIYNDVTFF